MKSKIVLMALVLSASTCLLTAQDTPSTGEAQRPPGAESGPRGGARGGYHLLPPGAAERLNLTDDQKKQIADLETDVKAKLGKILTADQMEQLKKMHPPRQQRNGGGGGGGQGGPDGGPGGGGPDGGQGGAGGPPPNN